MLIVALGIPSAFAAWGVEVVRYLAQSAHPDLQMRWIDRADSFDPDNATPLLICSQFPSRSLRQAISTQQAPMIVFTTTGIDAVAHQRQFQPGLLEAVRTIGASVALIGDCRPQKRALLLDATTAPSEGIMIQAIAHHIGCGIAADAVDAVLASVGPMPQQTASTFTEAEEGIVTLVLENGIAHLRDAGVPLRSIWPHRVFFSGDRPNEEAPLVMDATGGSRVLYYGPYFHLAEGRWRAKLTLGFTKEAVGLPLKMAAFGPGLLGEARLRPRQEGIFAAQFSFLVSEPENPVEFHVRTEEGAIEGRIALGQVELSHLGHLQQAS